MLSSLLKEAVVEGLLIARFQPKPETRAGIGLWILSGLLAAAGVFFLIYACFIWLQLTNTLLASALWIGLGLLVVAVAIGTGACLLMKKHRIHRNQKREEELIRMIRTVFEVLEQEIETPIQDNPKTAMLVAGLAGLFAAKHLH